MNDQSFIFLENAKKDSLYVAIKGLMFICDQLPLAEPLKPEDGFAANTTAKYN